MPCPSLPRLGCFDPRPRVGATWPTLTRRLRARSFDPRPRVGATSASAWGTPLSIVSIHAPVWGRRSRGRPDPLLLDSFDPRPRVGATDVESDPAYKLLVSIHAPVWGRPIITGSCVAVGMFRSTPPCGGDRQRQHRACSAAAFRSTPPCGGDRLHSWCRAESHCFDPRPRVGATSWRLILTPCRASFDPRPRVGATREGRHLQCRIRVSIHAPVWGRLRVSSML